MKEYRGRPRRRVQLYDSQLPMDTGDKDSFRYRRSDDSELSRIELEFCFRWTSCYQGARAAIEAGYNPARAAFVARKLLDDPRIKRQVALIEADRLKRLKFDGDRFLAREILLAEANPAELIEVVVPPCRYCWGRNFEYQRTHAEFQEAFEVWMRLPEKKRGRQAAADFGYGEVLVYDEGGSKLPFDQRGGDGYDVDQPPNPVCPNCRGRGLEIPGQGTLGHIKLKDTRELSDIGKLLYAGAEHTKNGVKILVRNQDAARGRLMSMLTRFLELKAQRPDVTDFGINLGGSEFVPPDDPRSLSDQQLDTMLASYGIVIDDSDQSG